MGSTAEQPRAALSPWAHRHLSQQQHRKCHDGSASGWLTISCHRAGEAWGWVLQKGCSPDRQSLDATPVWETATVITYAPKWPQNEEVGPAWQLNFPRRLKKETKGEDNYSPAKHISPQVPPSVQWLREALPVQSFVCSWPSTEHCSGTCPSLCCHPLCPFLHTQLFHCNLEEQWWACFQTPPGCCWGKFHPRNQTPRSSAVISFHPTNCTFLSPKLCLCSADPRTQEGILQQNTTCLASTV